MNFKKQIFGIYEGETIHQFILENDKGLVVKMMNFGATITSITIPGADEQPISIACGFDKFEDYFSDEYKANSPYFGCTVGRYCSQIKNALFTIDGEEYALSDNGGVNNLHGGTLGFDKRVWEAIPFESKDEIGVVFTLLSADLEEGFPGNVQASVQIKLTNNNEIIFNYNGITDKVTPLSMTNHTYFNLSGFKESIENNWVQVNTNKLLELDETGAATGSVKDVSSTNEDLRSGRMVKAIHLALNDGFEHFYVFDNMEEKLIPVAQVEDKTSGRKLEVFSTEPCMLFYTAKYMSDALQRNPSEKYGKYRAFACETHRWPNGPNLPNSPNTFLQPGEKFSSKTIYKLKW